MWLEMAVKFWRRSKSGRSDIHACNGMVASSQPLASSVGIQILQAGGSACDAIVAMASVLNVVEPLSTGIGGDAFVLLFVPGDATPKAINGSGYAPKNLTYEYLKEEKKLSHMPQIGVLPITVPGAVSAWETMHKKYGRLAWEDILRPAINYARNGFPVSPVISQVWGERVSKLLNHNGAKKTYLIQGERAPRSGEIFKQESLASTLEIIAKHGADVFYQGEIALRITEFIQKEGGYIQESDLRNFKAEWTEPISLDFYDHVLWEHGPNGQGIVTLMILSIAEELDIGRYTHGSPDYFHSLIEAKKMAFTDAFEHIADPKWMKISPARFLSEQYAQTRASQINPRQATRVLSIPLDKGTDTVYLTVADKDGIVISFINSLYSGFGSGVVDPQTGITFQNRGAGFSLEKDHPNQYAPEKRPYHTIIPAMVTSPNNELVYSFGVMGGHHQPQGQAQVFLNLVLHGMSPQEALEYPRFHHDQVTNTVALEDPIEIGLRAELRRREHHVVDCIGTNFGGGQIIQKSINDCYIGGSDPRKDGQAQGY